MPPARLRWCQQPPGSARSIGVGAPLGLRVSSDAVPMLLCLPSSRDPATASGSSETETSLDTGFPSPSQAWIRGIRAGSVSSCGNHVKASCRWIAFNAEAAGEAQGKVCQARLGGWDGFAPVVPAGLVAGSAPQTTGGTRASGGGFPQIPPKIPPKALTVPHLLACIAKLGAPHAVSQAGGVPGSILWVMGRLVGGW